MLNRSALIVRYKEPALHWINDVDPRPGGPLVTFDDVNEDLTVYLVHHKVADTAEKRRQWIRSNFRKIFESELGGWYADPGLWPEELTLKMFDEWFFVEGHTMIFDTLGGAIEDDEI